jgi:hypothetical protein
VVKTSQPDHDLESLGRLFVQTHCQPAILRLLTSAPLVAAFVVVAALLGMTPAIGHAEDRLRQLPKDGTWVRYQKDVANLTNDKKYDPIKVTLSFVGSAVDEGEPCRWLELKHVIPEGRDGAGTYVSKVLVPERDLLESESPFEHARRTWVRRLDGPVTKAPEGGRDDMTFGELLLWTPGMLKGSSLAKDQTKDIEYQRGRLKGAQARTGRLVHQWRDKNGTEDKYTKSYTAWQHPDLPIGFAEARIVQEQFINDRPLSKFSIDYRIEDAGADAKTELPDNN